jgi:hypothetical protein
MHPLAREKINVRREPPHGTLREPPHASRLLQITDTLPILNTTDFPLYYDTFARSRARKCRMIRMSYSAYSPPSISVTSISVKIP